MKKLSILLILTILVLCLALTACQSGDVNQEGANVFPVSAKDDTLDVTMGDVMPFYDNGVMNIYHLRNSSSANPLFYHPIARLTTEDFIHYTNKDVALNYVEEDSSPDAALGTGSFIKDADGLYHCFYTGHNGSAGSYEALKHVEVIRHATSRDQETWEKDESFNLYGDKDDFRDPYVYWDDVDNTYYMLVTTRNDSTGIIRRYKSTNLSATAENWEDVGTFFENDSGTYNMECPSYVKLGNFYYLAYSEQGDNRVTHYRYKTSHDDAEWRKFECDSIDAAGFYAGRLEKAGDTLYAFAWCARLSGGTTGGFDWGGNLVTHQIKQLENGELCAVMPDSYKEFFSHEVGYHTVDGERQSEFVFEQGKFRAFGLQKLSENVTRISFTVQVTNKNGNFGMAFGLDGEYNNRLGSAVVAFDMDKNTLTCYNNVSSILRYGAPLTSVNFQYQTGVDYSVDVIIDGEVMTVYLNNQVALTSRITDMQDNFAFYSNGTGVTVKDVRFYE